MSITCKIHIFLFFTAFAIRVGLAAGAIGLSAPPKEEANPDQIDYEGFANYLCAGDGYVSQPGMPTARRPPGTSFVLAPVYATFGRSFAAGRLWFCLMSAACCPIAGLIAHRLAGRGSGLLAAAWLAIYPGQAYYAVHFLSETPITLFTGLALAFHLHGLRKPVGWSDALAGLAWGICILIRPNLVLAGGLCCSLVLFCDEGDWKRRSWKACVIAVSTAVVVVPWIVRNQIVMGKPTLCTVVGGYTFWGSYNPIVANDPKLCGYWVSTSSLVELGYPLPGGEIERENAAWSHAWAFIRDRPDRLPSLKLHAVLRIVWAYSEAGNRALDLALRLSWISSLPLVVIGIVRLARRSPSETLYLLTPIVAVLATAILFYGCSRFRDSASPVLAVFVAAGVLTLVESTQRRLNRLWPRDLSRLTD